ncbi:MAG: adenylate kinase family protein [Candidatus Bathyarchaeia archaeon]
MSQPLVVLITGVPGTGKTTVSSILANSLGGDHVEITHLVRDGGMSLNWDQSRATSIADVKALRHALSNIIAASTKPVVVDGHYSPDVVPRDAATLVVVLRRAPWVLRAQLQQRGYSPRKIRENVEAELIGTCLVDALESQDHAKICEIDTTGQAPEETVKLVLAALDGEAACGYGSVDWMDAPEAEALLRDL